MLTSVKQGTFKRKEMTFLTYGRGASPWASEKQQSKRGEWKTVGGVKEQPYGEQKVCSSFGKELKPCLGLLSGSQA